MSESTLDVRTIVADRIREEQRAWRDVVSAVGMDRMDEPGPMGEWTFRDLAWHLLAWRERTLARLEAGAAGAAMPHEPWPDGVADVDAINDWMQAQGEGRSAAEVLEAVDRSFDRLVAALTAFSDEQLLDPAGLPGYEDIGPGSEVDWLSHWHDEHEAEVRSWLAERDRRP
jgi:hypothetical protein